MNTAKYDEDMSLETNLNEKNIVFHNVKDKPFKIYGAYSANHGEPFMRMNSKVANKISEGLGYMQTLASGIRVRFKTDSPYIAISVKYPKMENLPHITLLATCGFDMYTVEDKKHIYANFRDFIPKNNVDVDGYESIHYFQDKKMRDIIINFPLYNSVAELYVGLEDKSVLLKGGDYSNEKRPVVYYGSSIIQGGCASRPGLSYPAILSRMLDCDFLSLTFSGMAKAEDEMAEYISNLDMSCYVSEYDMDCPDVDTLQERLNFFVDTIRKRQPELPIILLTSTPRLQWKYEAYEPRKEVIRKICETRKQKGDKNIYYVDCLKIIENAGWDDCLVDGVHMNDLGFKAMAEGIYPTLKKALNL